ncbi:hypothetical protein LshimejAT787_1302890 [Lyophyllum shimeji]|uniref:Uncharacterized protein n=1 Tax=Lyophyllum shimeji TaxID=47721 RepID=A0A9P3US84_LYOSH|nr:hypothetical protein LshimejAT787_1302890 [Lyophyllum shimeji]
MMTLQESVEVATPSETENYSPTLDSARAAFALEFAAEHFIIGGSGTESPFFEGGPHVRGHSWHSAEPTKTSRLLACRKKDGNYQISV